MRADPGEMVNLASNPKFSEILNAHRGLLMQWSREHMDSFPVPQPT